MNAHPRRFEARPAVRETVPLLVGLMGPSGGGKTYSALRLATGIQEVTGGDIAVIDTESRRALHYADDFRFKHVQFEAPFGSLDYLEAIRQCASQGARVIVVDSMTHEHTGEGGYLDLHEHEIDRIAGADRNDRRARQKHNFAGWIVPASQRRKMIDGILHLGAEINMIFCFRAKEKIKPKPGGQPEEMGFMPIAGEELLFEMTVNALLMPKAGGVPTWRSDHVGERLMMKLPKQFDAIFQKARPLDEEIGRYLADWARGAQTSDKGDRPALRPRVSDDERLAEIERSLADEAENGIAALRDEWNSLHTNDRVHFKGLMDRKFKPRAAAVDEARNAQERAPEIQDAEEAF